MRRYVKALAVVAAAAAACGLTAGCEGSGSATPRDAGGPAPAGGASHSPGSTPTPTVPPVRLRIDPATGSTQVRSDAPIRVSAAGGKLRTVTVRSAGGRVSGALSAGRTAWHSTAILNVNEQYTVTAVGVNSAGRSVTDRSTFRTLSPTETFRAHIDQALNATYGVGMPIQLSFDRPITDKAEVEKALQLRTSKPVIGAWYWIDDEHLDFRPRDYWPAHTSVSFVGNFDGVQGAPGVYGTADLTQQFTIGESLIVQASARTHRMQLYRDGRKIDDWPISTGKAGHDTPDGTFVTISKGNPVEMKPSDIRPGRPGYYDLKVPWSVRFTWSGDFLHDAYWSVAQQGAENVSHGCVNMPPAAAEKYYKMVVPGDPVTISGSPLAGTPGDGWTDWFYSWPQLLDRSALHEAVSAGPHGSRFVRPSALPADTATAPLGRPAPDNSGATTR